ncbi:peptidoglycan/LPS O-acetylase OafA/YrhL [Duganella sp. 1224]|uniref:acyltransferase family protein n=1 Tax=Duganella sp. 1224 TaxID=2587052 RepID=UPI0015CC8DB2|nr:acyltransferase [Duganella sp. 1224]NYE62160.1 peptidoglycan/LPS O-acetylase OafA/YrhL [Duganella sp. 1224]
MTSQSSTEFHLPSLDGIRALAVMIVFLSHAGWGHLIPGGLGVTIFFFLSGYLITTLMRREYARRQRIDFKAFYLRRVYRILPPMYLVLFSLLILWLAGAVPGQVTPGGVLAQVLQVTNYYVIQPDNTGIVPYTGTFWSLAVEEHFYLVFPLLFALGARRWPLQRLALLLLGLCGLVLLWRCVLVYGWHVPSNRTYMATDTRFDNMLFGCIMALWRNPALDAGDLPGAPRQRGLWLAGAGGLLLLTLVVRDPALRETWRYTLQGLALFPLFWLAVRYPAWWPFRWLNWRPVQWVGLVSYVFYLSHFYFLALCEQWLGQRTALVAAAALVLTLAYSALVYQLVELPFARLRRRLHTELPPARTEAAAAAAQPHSAPH